MREAAKDGGPRCAVCGANCRKPFRAPSAELAPDLDGRPGEPARSTLPHWVQTCPGCGAAGPDLAALPEGAAATIAHPDYAAEPDPFRRWALIAEAAGLPQTAAEALLQAAWRAEDQGHDGTALRREAAARWQGDPLRRLDILRRAGALDEAAALADGLTGLGEDGRRLVAFQQARITAADTGRHAISSALRPPARTPHVAHARRTAGTGGGLLARLLGR